MRVYIFLSLFNEEYRRMSNDSWIKKWKTSQSRGLHVIQLCSSCFFIKQYLQGGKESLVQTAADTFVLCF